MVSPPATDRWRLGRVAAVALWLGSWSLLVGQSCGSGVTYVYDANGRLVAVVDPSQDSSGGGTAIYKYDAAGNLTGTTRQATSALQIISFTPPCGPTTSTLTIYGTGFSPTASNNTVTFENGMGATAVPTSATATELIVTVPGGARGARSGTITVTVGTATSPLSSQSFTVGCGAPTITSFSPPAGNPGDAVTITGTNFDTTAINDRVTFNARFASVLSSPAPTAMQLSTQAPTNATSGKIVLTTPQGRAVSPNDFFVPPPFDSYTVAKIDLTQSGRMENPTSTGKTASVTVTSDQSIVLTLFDEVQNDRVCAYLTNDPFGVRFQLFDPVGTELWETACTAGCYPALYNSPAVPLSFTGTYTLVTAPYAGQTGTLTLTVYRVDPDVVQTVPACTAVPCSPFRVNITTACQLAFLKFNGIGGHRLSATATNPSPTAFTWSYDLRDANNGYIGPGVYNQNCAESAVLPSDGTYTLKFIPGDRQTGSVDVRLYDVVDASTPITIGSNPVTTTLTARTPGENPNVTFQARTATLSASWTAPTWTSPENATGAPTIRLYDSATPPNLIAESSGSSIGPVTVTPGNTYRISADFWHCSTGYLNLTVTN